MGPSGRRAANTRVSGRKLVRDATELIPQLRQGGFSELHRHQVCPGQDSSRGRIQAVAAGAGGKRLSVWDCAALTIVASVRGRIQDSPHGEGLVVVERTRTRSHASSQSADVNVGCCQQPAVPGFTVQSQHLDVGSHGKAFSRTCLQRQPHTDHHHAYKATDNDD